MKKIIWTSVALLVFATIIGVSWNGLVEKAGAQTTKPPAGAVPIFQVDPTWLKMPNGWVLGQVAAVSVDARDNVWILHRYRTVKPELKAAPPVLHFDSAGNFIKAWGGPGEGYDWPSSEHGLSVDYKGFVWVGGGGGSQALKFTQDGKFVMQIGKKDRSKGHTDTENFVSAEDVFVWPKTNELFVGDTGGGRGRVMVIDADTGKFKRMWGAFGNPPADAPPNEPQNGRAGAVGMDVDDGIDPPYLTEAHRVQVSNDGLVYVCDGPNKRFQVFTVDGKFVKEVYVNRGKKPMSIVPTVTMVGNTDAIKWGEANKPVAFELLINHHETSSALTLSTDPQQQYLYASDQSREKVLIYDRKSLTLIGEFGDGPGQAPGQFYILHDLSVDSHGNMYVAEVDIGSRVQKFILKGYMTPISAK